MTAFILDGKALAQLKKNELKLAIHERLVKGLRAPALAVILVGDDPASHIYVTNKSKACEEVGITSKSYHLPTETSEQQLLDLIDELNHSPAIDGILVQLPLPDHMDTHKIIECISPLKDVDGFHPYNLGRLAQRLPLMRPCTPYGIIQLLKANGIALRGRHTVVIGASNIVGRPMGLEFLAEGATVTICHRFTRHLEEHVRMADVLVVATGKQDVIEAKWLHRDQVIIDVGIHRLKDGKLRGDVDFNQAVTRVGWITPVPGGVGPMTITALLQNTVFAATHHHHNGLP
ncbi:bifunctional methylenetetrahydrofolate dehydrogenase/methenyltetrahydrofolate cyclohydrolase FolD [Legionella erythra]|uniref:Bifunctional protein FolD n=1 Tax=Legionella erythra TaxID=448 RepID=A0A0W0TPL4_LEGER|nr:bifunctional methylenetetrahydrofolate dehydrogenase/methenyltetrahydrofolate cyclohydrolase FolD [Legionella erythra]KTC97543.1 Bifunctional Methylenetetrahydrofolate dehydrogenase/Methenyltetrahydrofolate cyclohydrolase FolD [Legionella erythra]